jgi:hypothetical protein
MPDQPETFAALLRRYRDDDDDEPGEVHRISFAEAVRSGDDPLHILKYMKTLGIATDSISDLIKIGQDDSEDSVSVHVVSDGIAVTHDGIWVLFEP